MGLEPTTNTLKGYCSTIELPTHERRVIIHRMRAKAIRYFKPCLSISSIASRIFARLLLKRSSAICSINPFSMVVNLAMDCYLLPMKSYPNLILYQFHIIILNTHSFVSGIKGLQIQLGSGLATWMKDLAAFRAHCPPCVPTRSFVRAREPVACRAQD